MLINLAQNGHVCCHAVGQVSQIPAHRLGLGDTEEESLHFFLCHCSFAPVNEWEREPWYQPGQFSPAALVRSPVGAVVGLQGCASQPAPTTAGLLLELQLLAWDVFGLTFCNTASSCSLTALGAVWQKSLEADISVLWSHVQGTARTCSPGHGGLRTAAAHGARLGGRGGSSISGTSLAAAALPSMPQAVGTPPSLICSCLVSSLLPLVSAGLVLLPGCSPRVSAHQWAAPAVQCCMTWPGM